MEHVCAVAEFDGHDLTARDSLRGVVLDTRRLRYPLIKEYTLNCCRILNMI